ncbi:hypothetical protein MPTK2_8g13980 [Marchantia polymorpha subsp. ruderalis]
MDDLSEDEAGMATTRKKVDRDGGSGNRDRGTPRSKAHRGRGPALGCSWQCIWAMLIIWSTFLFLLATIGPICSLASAASNVEAQFGFLQALSCCRHRPDRGTGVARDDGSSRAGWSGDVRTLTTPWNRLCYGEKPPATLRIALFVKKWPVGGTPGGLERHAMTLHGELARRGHEVEVFTMSGDGSHPADVRDGNLRVHFVKPNANGGLPVFEAWELFARANASRAFDLVHSESVALPHWRAKDVPAMAASWHGIAFEVIHSDIVQDLIRKPGQPRSPELQKNMHERLLRVSDEVRFFHSYKHHVATSDFVSDVLRTVYELPEANVHTILNGVDESKFRPDPVQGAAFRAQLGVPARARLVLGAAGRLVRDKGHPLLFEAFREILKEHDDVYLLIAGAGPWGERYKELGPNAKTLGSMNPADLGQFYNSLDVFANPTLRSQGLDHTLLEAMQCGKPLLATKFSSITRSVVISSDFGYTFSPNVEALIAALRAIIRDGKDKLREKGESSLEYASFMFTATKMAASYERLFLCMKNEIYCHYPLPHDCLPHRSKYFSD